MKGKRTMWKLELEIFLRKSVKLFLFGGILVAASPSLSHAVELEDPYTVLPRGTQILLSQSFENSQTVAVQDGKVVGGAGHPGLPLAEEGVHCLFNFGTDSASFHANEPYPLYSQGSWYVPSYLKEHKSTVHYLPILKFGGGKTLELSCLNSSSPGTVVQISDFLRAIGTLAEFRLPDGKMLEFFAVPIVDPPSTEGSLRSIQNGSILLLKHDLELVRHQTQILYSSDGRTLEWNLKPQVDEGVTVCRLIPRQVQEYNRIIPVAPMGNEFGSCLKLKAGKPYSKNGFNFKLDESEVFEELDCFKKGDSPPTLMDVHAALDRSFLIYLNANVCKGPVSCVVPEELFIVRPHRQSNSMQRQNQPSYSPIYPVNDSYNYVPLMYPAIIK